MYIYQVERDLLEKSIKKFSNRLRGKVLDAGSGSGRYADLFRENKYVSLDINSEHNPNIIGSIEMIPCEDNSFDSVICTQVLGDIIEPLKAVKEFYRILKPGGVILATEGCIDELYNKPQDFWRFTPGGMQKLFELAGFNVEIIENIGGIFCVTVQLYTKFFINSLNLHSHRLIGKIFSRIFFIFGKLAIGLDKLRKGKTNSEAFLDIIIVAKKSKAL